jgi:hypothetical protein
MNTTKVGDGIEASGLISVNINSSNECMLIGMRENESVGSHSSVSIYKK